MLQLGGIKVAAADTHQTLDHAKPRIEMDVDRVTIDVQSSSSMLFVARLVGNEDRVHDPCHARSFLGERLGIFAL
jgi:hypothetical protein